MGKTLPDIRLDSLDTRQGSATVAADQATQQDAQDDKGRPGDEGAPPPAALPARRGRRGPDTATHADGESRASANRQTAETDRDRQQPTTTRASGTADPADRRAEQIRRPDAGIRLPTTRRPTDDDKSDDKASDDKASDDKAATTRRATTRASEATRATTRTATARRATTTIGEPFYNDRDKLDFDPDEGFFTGTAVDGGTEHPGRAHPRRRRPRGGRGRLLRRQEGRRQGRRQEGRQGRRQEGRQGRRQGRTTRTPTRTATTDAA